MVGCGITRKIRCVVVIIVDLIADAELRPAAAVDVPEVRRGKAAENGHAVEVCGIGELAYRRLARSRLPIGVFKAGIAVERTTNHIHQDFAKGPVRRANRHIAVKTSDARHAEGRLGDDRIVRQRGGIEGKDRPVGAVARVIADAEGDTSRVSGAPGSAVAGGFQHMTVFCGDGGESRFQWDGGKSRWRCLAGIRTGSQAHEVDGHGGAGIDRGVKSDLGDLRVRAGSLEIDKVIMILAVRDDRERGGFLLVPRRVAFGDVEQLRVRAGRLPHADPDVGREVGIDENRWRANEGVGSGSSLQFTHRDRRRTPIVEAAPTLKVAVFVEIP